MTRVHVADLMQTGYSYELTEPEGKNFDSRFRPDLTPKQMLAMGVFGGTYLNDCEKEFLADWFTRAKMSPQGYNPSIRASQPLSVWRAKGWIYKDDPRGWFQWYCRYYRGRRIPIEDDRQIGRWLAMRRHITQIIKNCRSGDLACRARQRQALLHWAYDSRKL